MSITDDVRAAQSQGGDRSGSRASGEAGFDRTPPQDIAAEQCVLGGMLLSKDAIADVVEIVRTVDFYRPAHATIFDAILDLYGRGEPADPITVAAALTDAGDAARIGGVPYLHDLVSIVPTAANAAYYARIVAERAVLRRLVEAGTRIVQLGYGAAGGGGRDVDDTVDLAQQEIYNVTEKRVSEDFAVLAEMLQPTLDEIEAVGAQGGVMTGVPTGFTDLDRLLNGLHAGQLVIVAGRPGLGKALALDTPLPTPDGWTTMGAVTVGDRLLDGTGQPTTVVATSPVMLLRACFEVEFSDGTVIVADGEHRWFTRTTGERLTGHPGSVRTTDQIRATLHLGGGPHHSVSTCAPLELPERRVPMPPYTMGVVLAGGTGPHDPEIRLRLAADMQADGPLVGEERVAGERADVSQSASPPGPAVACDPDVKRIPVDYLRASVAQRRALLTGLLDVAGRVGSRGAIRLRVLTEPLADDVYELLVGLGYRCTRRPASAAGQVLSFTASDDVFGVHRKALLHKERRQESGAEVRYIVAVRRVASVPVRCVTVDNDDHLYLAGRSMVPTHNSTAGMDFARSASVKHNLASAIFSLEMSKVEIVMRLLSAEARVPLHVLRSGQLSDVDWTKLARRIGEISEAPLFVDDTPNMTLMEIRAKARRLKQRNDLKLIVVDYLQLMTSPKRVESRQQEVAELSRGLKLLAKEVECPVVAVSQLNRGPEQRTDKRPQLSDLRESGCLTAATLVIRADTNAPVTLGELRATNARNIPVWALNDRLQYVPSIMTHVFPTGRRQVYRVLLASGKEIEATANHRFLTVGGWRPIGELGAGDRLAVPRHVPPPESIRRWPDGDVIRLAERFGDGCLKPKKSVRDSGRDEIALSAAAFVPSEVFALPADQVVRFLRRLWAKGGSISFRAGGRAGQIRFASPSRRLADDLALLLLRFGVSTRLRVDRSDAGGLRSDRLGASRLEPVGPARYLLDVCGRDDQLRFLRKIGMPGTSAARLAVELEGAGSGPLVDAVPKEIWSSVRAALTEQRTDLTEQQDGRRRPAPASSPLALVADVLDAADLELLATNDVLWDDIRSVVPLGEQDVFDATVLGNHNFIANGIAVHNSIEQDADVVILLHRDDYYDKESPRAGEADFIVAKHRNGPTDTITVAAQLHLSRFVDMAVV